MNSSTNPDPEQVKSSLARVAARLESLANQISERPQPQQVPEWLELRAHIGRELGSLDDLMGELDVGFEVRGGKTRLLEYLRAHLGKTVSKHDLAGVAGISEWARRVRELREDDGWVIHTNTTNPSMSPGSYRLVSDEPHPEIVKVWSSAKAAAKLTTRGGVLDAASRLSHFLDDIAPSAAAIDQLSHVVGGPRAVEDALAELLRRGLKVERLPPTDPIRPRGVRLAGH